ncbi:hypothetical protein [Halocatena salina]|uniref:Uncharacterized protein n=1 Tax=Halocatena salina TaxID=2934340 RepID=A0A8U0A2U9_9EURY|nr:hypothetical protein [Halocatena salina]UPM42307.1 hypothetical protein MW046_10095 [Halocatena salina]
MTDRSSSLLTPAQRDRLGRNFDDVDAAKRRRDQQRIRQRLNAGIEDYELLAELPDRQFELAFKDRQEDHIRRGLADAYRTLERIRTVHELDRDKILQLARERDRDRTDDSALTLRTRADWRCEFEDEIASQYQPTRWKRLSDVLLKIGLALLIFVSFLAVIAPDFTNGLGSIPGIVGAGVLAVGLLIVGLRSVKYDVVPMVRALYEDPRRSLRTVWEQM